MAKGGSGYEEGGGKRARSNPGTAPRADSANPTPPAATVNAANMDILNG